MPTMKWKDVVDCPPFVQITGDPPQPAYLLAWMRMEITGEWRAIVTYIRQVGERPAERMLVNVGAGRVKPLMPPAAYKDVRRIQLCRDGDIRDWEPEPPAEP
ncbi:hypothetical protein F8566_20355 [Actinomadura rudentiformis]|uniref:Uncharacterized protein n=2 Tax=Actinomadura rudentiformis TaxID=359158 RepID=A0A6H9Z278_9ACTN|nr:hypothetical protein F8566_20355 [Actinomadura rudentiformis]